MISSNVHNILHFVDKNNPNGPYPSNPRNDPQYENWEYSVQQWRRKTFPPITTFNFTTSEAETDTQDE
jgi:hypothetical protein